MRILNLALALALLASATGAVQSDARAAFESAARGFEHGLDYGDVLYGRIDPVKWANHGSPALAELFARRDSIEDLAALLDHSDPRVRTLALAARASRVEALAADGSRRARATLQRLIRDPRFAQIDLGTLRVFVEVVNRWVEPDLVDRDHLHDFRHPLGDSGLASPRRIEIAMEQYPATTKQVLAELDRWRALVLASIERWTPPARK
jgi:hypothetical protein